jgi:hypothetical protein
MSDRLHCLVPGCKRTHPPVVDAVLGVMDEWICPVHWRMVDALQRKRYNRAKRMWRGAVAAGDFTRGNHHHRTHWFLRWDIVKRQAIERSMGI